MVKFARQNLAWSPELEEKKRISRITCVIAPIFLLLSVYVTWTELPPLEREEIERLPPQLAKIVLKKKQIEVPKKKPEPVAEVKPEPEDLPITEPKVVPKPKPKLVKKPKPSESATKEQVQAARDKAKQSGLLAMGSQLSKMSALASNISLNKPSTITAKPIARKVNDKLASRATNSELSAGVQASDLNTETQTLQLASRSVASVEQNEEVIASERVRVAQKEKMLADRSTQEIRKTMDANKSSINSIYNRALRKQPSLQGVITPELVIEQTGVVSRCTIVESTLNEPDLERKICNRLRLVNFGAKTGVEAKTVRYPIELLPG